MMTKEQIKNPHFVEGKSAFYSGLELSDNPHEIDTVFYIQWASGWNEALQSRNRMLEAQYKVNNNKIFDRDGTYPIVGLITGVIVFFACWICAIASWGFLLGVGLGWIPSFFIAVIAGFIWPLLALILVGAIGIAIIAFLIFLIWGT